MNTKKSKIIAELSVLVLLIFYLLFGKQPDKILTDWRKAKEAQEQLQRKQKKLAWELAWGKTHVETEIQGKEVDDEDFTEQIDDFLLNNINILGQWNGPGFDDGVSLTINGDADGELNVLYFADGDVSRWRLERTGRFEAGVLILDRPVMGYPGDVYRRFYAIQTPNGPRLATQSFVRNWMFDYDLRNWKREEWLFMDRPGGLLKKETEQEN
jgi:hypothetical protein